MRYFRFSHTRTQNTQHFLKYKNCDNVFIGIMKLRKRSFVRLLSTSSLLLHVVTCFPEFSR